MLEQELEKLHGECEGCTGCALCSTRTNLVFGVGNPSTGIMLIGEGPGEQEDIQGIPFVGRAGQLLDDMLKMIDLDRSKLYIANVVKCRPPKNRDPLAEEQAACRKWLDHQMQLIDPKIVVCLGRIAAAAVIHEDYRITREHGQWSDVGGIRMTAIYHPAALLRDVGKRPETFADLRSIRSEIRRLCPEVYR